MQEIYELDNTFFSFVVVVVVDILASIDLILYGVYIAYLRRKYIKLIMPFVCLFGLVVFFCMFFVF